MKIRVFGRRRRAAMWRYLGVVVASLALLLAAAIPAAAAELMRVTFVRHGESAGNASGLIDTSTPGPVLTPLGQQQSQAVVGTLGDNNYDAIYGSSMVRTQLTGAPMSQYLRLPIQVLPGLQEIEAGVFEGTPEADAADGYGLFPLAWTFQGNRDLRIPGSINGHEFDARVDGALQTIYDNGDRNPVVFSHGGTIMFWTMMNTQNLTMEQKIELLRNYHLGNTDYVVIEGNPEDGWTLVNWNGQQFSPERTLGAEVLLQVRTLVRQLADTTQQVVAAFATRDVATIATAINRGIADAVYSIAKFGRAVNAKVINELENRFSPPASSDDSEVAPDVDTAAATLVSESATSDESDAAAETDPGADGTATPSAASDDGVQPLTAREADPVPSATQTPEAADTPDPISAASAAEEDSAEAITEDGTEENALSDGETDLTDGDEATEATRNPIEQAGDEDTDAAPGRKDTVGGTLSGIRESGTESGTAKPANDTTAGGTGDSDSDSDNDAGSRQSDAA